MAYCHTVFGFVFILQVKGRCTVIELDALCVEYRLDLLVAPLVMLQPVPVI